MFMNNWKDCRLENTFSRTVVDVVKRFLNVANNWTIWINKRATTEHGPDLNKSTTKNNTKEWKSMVVKWIEKSILEWFYLWTHEWHQTLRAEEELVNRHGFQLTNRSRMDELLSDASSLGENISSNVCLTQRRANRKTNVQNAARAFEKMPCFICFYREMAGTSRRAFNFTISFPYFITC